jgi:cytoskeletal protein RodZ
MHLIQGFVLWLIALLFPVIAFVFEWLVSFVWTLTTEAQTHEDDDIEANKVSKFERSAASRRTQFSIEESMEESLEDLQSLEMSNALSEFDYDSDYEF